jgi:hypothetical protein
MANEGDALGPISYLIVEFPGNKMTGKGLDALVDLVDYGIIRILDLAFVMRNDDGSITAIDLSDVDGDGELDLTVFEGISSGILGQDDWNEAANALEPGSSAGILLFENRWAIPFMQGIRSGGAEVVAAGYIPQDALVAALDALD